MNYFKTKAGTELPFLDLRGKKYIQVAHRLVWFREEYPNANIETEIVKIEDHFALFRATISQTYVETMPDGSQKTHYICLANAHGREDAKHFPDFIEKAETKAIGRALALCGYGTQFAPELEESHRVVDSPLPTTSKNAPLLSDQKKNDAQPPKDSPLVRHPAKGVMVTEPQRRLIFKLATDKGLSQDQLKDRIKTKFKIESSKDLTIGQATELIDELKAM